MKAITILLNVFLFNFILLSCSPSPSSVPLLCGVNEVSSNSNCNCKQDFIRQWSYCIKNSKFTSDSIWQKTYLVTNPKWGFDSTYFVLKSSDTFNSHEQFTDLKKFSIIKADLDFNAINSTRYNSSDFGFLNYNQNKYLVSFVVGILSQNGFGQNGNYNNLKTSMNWIGQIENDFNTITFKLILNVDLDGNNLPETPVDSCFMTYQAI